MLNEHILKKISTISTKNAYDELLNSLKTSEAPLEIREEAIRELKAQKPQFDAVDRLPSKELFEQLKDGEEDISDMGGFG